MIGRVSLLRSQFDHVLIPKEVDQELARLADAGASEVIRGAEADGWPGVVEGAGHRWSGSSKSILIPAKPPPSQGPWNGELTWCSWMSWADGKSRAPPGSRFAEFWASFARPSEPGRLRASGMNTKMNTRNGGSVATAVLLAPAGPVSGQYQAKVRDGTGRMPDPPWETRASVTRPVHLHSTRCEGACAGASIAVGSQLRLRR